MELLNLFKGWVISETSSPVKLNNSIASLAVYL